MMLLDITEAMDTQAIIDVIGARGLSWLIAHAGMACAVEADRDDISASTADRLERLSRELAELAREAGSI